MKNQILLIITVVSFLNCNAQFGSQQIITSEASLARDVFTADIDGDGDLDVLSASRTGGFNIAWYENLNGLGGFGTFNIIEDNLFDQVYSVYAADLDNDGDIDVLTTATSFNQVIWYENLDGLGNFGTRQIISSNADGAFDVIAADIDDDGDMDVISAASNGVAWYENNGLGNFSSAITIFYVSSRSIITGDIDNDGDLDIIIASGGNAIVYWVENLDGTGSFGAPKIIAPVSPPSSTSSVFAVDIDGDNDLDVLAIPANERVVWYENLDGMGTFGIEQIVIDGLNFSVSVFSTDLDNDGDNDILYTNSFGALETNSIVAWHENLDGFGDFGLQKIIVNTLTSPRKVFSADIDNDGDMDVLSASQNDDTIAWYENHTILEVKEKELLDVIIYPNPVKDVLYFKNKEDIVFSNVMVIDVLGKIVFINNLNFNNLNLSKLNSGIYFIKIETENGTITRKIIKE